MRGADPRRERANVLEREVRDRRVRVGQLAGKRIAHSAVDVDTVRCCVRGRRLDGDRIVVECVHRCEAELRPRDGEHAGAAPDVEQRAVRQLGEQLEAEPRRRMCAGSERAAGLDDDDQGALRRLLPRRADPERSDPDAVVKLAPAILPALDDVDGGDVAERGSGSLLACRIGIRRQLDAGGRRPAPRSLRGTARALLRAPLPRVPEERRPRSVSAEVRLQAAEQARVVLVHRAVLARRKRLEKLPLLRREAPRNVHVHEHAMIAAAGSGEHRHALSAQNAHVARLGPGLELQLVLAVERRDRRGSRRAPPA